VKLFPVQLGGSSVDVTAARGAVAPDFVLPNGRGVGYGEFHLDHASLTWLLAHVPDVGDALTRGSAWVTLWDAMLDGDATPDSIITLALAALPRETDEQNAQSILGYLDAAYWRFIPDARRAALAARVEHTLRTGLEKAPTTTLKSAYFSTLRDVALTKPTLAWLTTIWHGDTRIPGLTLGEPDFIRLAEDLAVRSVPGWRMILDQQVERTKNPDRKARLRFVTPALSLSAAERDRFFDSLGNIANRQHEPWVVEAVAYLNHPLRAKHAEAYLHRSLDMLQDIQRTGDIFFPKRWMDASLSGHRSPEAAQIVRQFVADLPPGYPDRLRRVILSSADPLYRASVVR
jgi:aminopeptidase N